ncbi:MAG: hypothetical protein IT323_22670 [Anaerolineae bacterium]|nr:hypothetical protein [Anaerolineae bacterium]
MRMSRHAPKPGLWAGLALGLFTAVLTLTHLFSGAAVPAAAQIRQTPTPIGVECGRTITAIATLLRRDHDFDAATRPGSGDYCARLETEIAVFIEALLADPTAEGISGQSRGAFAFIDFGARQFVGEIPQGAAFKAVARNALPDSTMIYVVGPDYAVFVDYNFTTLSANEFASLPDYRDYTGGIRPNCEASWCRMPGPRPTQSR